MFVSNIVLEKYLIKLLCILSLTSNTTSILKRVDDIGSRITRYCVVKETLSKKNPSKFMIHLVMSQDRLKTAIMIKRLSVFHFPARNPKLSLLESFYLLAYYYS